MMRFSNRWVSESRRCSVRASDLGFAMCASTDPDMTQPVEDAEDVEQPQDYEDHHDAIEDRFDAALHGNEPIHNPEQNADNDEGKHKMHKWHRFLIS